jgi:hypothetical protein
MISQAKADFSGSASGTFINPVGPAGMFTVGVGTNAFVWGTPADTVGPSSLEFAGNFLFNTPAETAFHVGRLTYFNGTTVLGTEASGVDLSLLISFIDPVGVNKTFQYSLGITTTPNGGVDPVADADIVTLPSVPAETFDVGGTTYTLHLEFANFTENSLGNANQFKVYEDAKASADVIGTITTNVNGVPDNSATVTLLGAALLGMVAVRRKIAR